MIEINTAKKHSERKIYSFSKWVIRLFLLLSILFLIFTFYRAEIIFKGDIEAFIYPYLISLASVVFWGLLLKFKDNLRTNVLIVCFSLVIGIYLIEGFLFYLNTGTTGSNRIKSAENLGIEFDARTKLQVIKDLIDEGVDAIPQFSPIESLTEKGGLFTQDGELFFPLAGVSRKTTVFCNESGEYSIYLSDRYGFNNPDSEWEKEEVDWLILGDSFAQGACVNSNDNIAGQIRFITRGDTVINLGNGGNGPLMELATLKEYAEPIRPKKIIWIYYEGNDLADDLPVEESIPLLMNYLNPLFSQRLIHKQKDIDSSIYKFISEEMLKIEKRLKSALSWVDSDINQEKNDFSLSNFLRLVRLCGFIQLEGAFLSTLYFSDNDINPLFIELLTTARNHSLTWGGQFYFVHIPIPSKATKKDVIGAVRKLNIPVIDIYQEIFDSNPNWPSLFPLGVKMGHYSPEGYKKIAEVIVSEIP